MEGQIFSGDFLMTTVLFGFLLVYGRNILVLQFFFINLPLKLFNFNFMLFFLKKYFDSESWRKKFGWTGEKNIFRLSQYNHIQNFEENKLFQHFANLITIRSTHLLPILDLIIHPLPEGEGGILFYLCPSVLPKYFSSHFSQQLLMAEIWYLVTSFT